MGVYIFLCQFEFFDSLKKQMRLPTFLQLHLILIALGIFSSMQLCTPHNAENANSNKNYRSSMLLASNKMN